MSSPSGAEPQRNESDPTLVRNQPALRTSNGNLWLIVGVLFTAVSLTPIVLIAREPGPAAPLALGTGIAIVALCLVLLILRFATAPGRRRLTLMAICMVSLAAIALLGVLGCMMLARAAIIAAPPMT